MAKLQVRKLRQRYEQAVRDKEISFIMMLDGEEYAFVTNYAKYMLEYLAMQGVKDNEYFELTKTGGIKE